MTRPSPEFAGEKPGRQVVVFGSGALAGDVVGALRSSGQVLVGAMVHSHNGVGADIGVLTGGPPCGISAEASLVPIMRRHHVDAVYYCGLPGPKHVQAIEEAVEAGLAFISGAGLVDAETELGPGMFGRLNARARATGARAVGTGVNPGLFLDTLPALLATTASGRCTVECTRTSSIGAWSASVLRSELGFGSDPSLIRQDLPLLRYLRQSAAALAASMGLSDLTPSSAIMPITTSEPLTLDGLVAAPGAVVGVRIRVEVDGGSAGHVALEWRGELDPPDEGLVIAIAGDRGDPLVVRAQVPANTYPATAARMVSSLEALYRMGPGLHSPVALMNLTPEASDVLSNGGDVVSP